MKVKISYSVALDEVPSRAKYILHEVEKTLLEACHEIPDITQQNLYGEEYIKFKILVDKIRKKLFIADAKMEDVLLILDDWKRATLALEVESLNSVAGNQVGVKNDKDDE
jgi:hypothetical protein